MTKLDKIDSKLLMLLQKNAKLNTKELANKVGLSVTPTYERIKRLEKQGLIDKYVALLNKQRIGKKVIVFCSVTLKSHTKNILVEFEKSIIKLPEIMECFHIAGNSDYLLKVIVDDMEEYHNFIKNKISTIDNISNVESSFVMSTIKESTVISLSEKT